MLTLKDTNYRETTYYASKTHLDLSINIIIKYYPSLHSLSETFVESIISSSSFVTPHLLCIKESCQFERKKSFTYYCKTFFSHPTPNASFLIHFNFIKEIAPEEYSTVSLSTI